VLSQVEIGGVQPNDTLLDGLDRSLAFLRESPLRTGSARLPDHTLGTYTDTDQKAFGDGVIDLKVPTIVAFTSSGVFLRPELHCA
jgi:hypothetical protein